MKLDDAKHLAESMGLEIRDVDKNNYKLRLHGEEVGTISLIRGSRDEYRFEVSSGTYFRKL